MSYVPASNYQIIDASNHNSLNNIYLYSIFPYFNLSNQLTWPCSWNASGTVQNPYSSWTGTITYSGTSNVYYGSGGSTQSCNLLSPTTPTSGKFSVTGNQVGSTVNAGNSCTATGQSWTFYVEPVLSNITFLSGTYSSLATYVTLMRLPSASSSIGQVFYICNYGNTLNPGAAVCSYANEPIDGVSNSAFRLTISACLGLTPNSNGTAWCIVSYYAGNLPPYAIGSVNGTVINSPVVICSNTGTGKTVCLPNPATWGNGNFLRVTTTQSATTAYSTAAQFAIYTGPSVGVSYFRQNSTANLYFSLLANADYSGNRNHNFSITFINDGTWWYIASVFDGQNCQIDNPANQGRTQITSPIFVNATGDGGNPSALVASVTNTALIMYMKMNHTSTSNGFVIQSYNNTSGAQNGYVCSSTANRCYKITGTLNYNAFPVIQAYWSNAVYNFPVGMYPSAY